MAHVESGSHYVSHVQENPVPLIPGLPDDVAHFCLARVPRRYHAVLKCVSKRWRALLCSEEWYAYRRKHSLRETWIYALCRDKFDQLCYYVLDPLSPRRSWKRIHDLPPQILRRKGIGFEVLGKKLYLLGGFAWLEDATDEAHCYDVSTNSWTVGPNMSTERYWSFFFPISNSKIYEDLLTCSARYFRLLYFSPVELQDYFNHSNGVIWYDKFFCEFIWWKIFGQTIDKVFGQAAALNS